MPFNRELLASLSFEPHVSKEQDTQSGIDDNGSAAEQNAPFGESSDDSDSAQNAATKLLIRCLKVALAKSITSISHPAKKRALNPQKDFTIETTVDYYGQGDLFSCCGGSSSVKQRRRQGRNSLGYVVFHDDTNTNNNNNNNNNTIRIGGSDAPTFNRSDSVVYDATTSMPVFFDEDEGNASDGFGRRRYYKSRRDYTPRTITDDDEDEEEDVPPVNFRFTDFSPMCYRHIREFFHVDSMAYGDVLRNSKWHSIPTPGKSAAQLFFCGRDWVIKTMTNQESDFLRSILHRYYYHVRDNPFTLLPHFVGHHRLEIGSKTHNIIIMQNVFATTNTIHEKFDLKGSTIGRFASDAEKLRATCTQKDLDINSPLHVGLKRRKLLIEQVKKDCEFLKHSRIMDYSFLVGIHVLPKEAPTVASALGQAAAGMALHQSFGHTLNPGGLSISPFVGALDNIANRSFINFASATAEHVEVGSDATDGRCFTADQGGMQSDSTPGLRREIYYIGIIDILQEYNTRKTLETAMFGIIHDFKRISCVNPNEYAARFIDFMSSIIV